MKVLIVGASGSIGGEALKQCLAHPTITSIIAFSRKELPPEITENNKVSVVIVTDFAHWEPEILESHADAAAMIWSVVPVE
jgi:uncharacterized protein YbjT (DUF2867 family)